MKDLWRKSDDYANDTQIALFLDLAHDWLVDSLQGKIVPPASASDASNSWKLAEAYYAIYLIIQWISDGEGFIEALAPSFQNEAYRLMVHIRDHADTGAGMQDGPQSTSTGVEPKFTRGKYDADGVLLGNKMGINDDLDGSLDDW